MRVNEMPRRVQAVLNAESDAERNALSELLDDREWRLMQAFMEHLWALREGRAVPAEGALL